MSRPKATVVLRFRIRPIVLGQSAEGYVNEHKKAHTQVTGEVEDARGDEVVEVGSGSGCPWLSQVRHLETSCLDASTSKSTTERLIPGAGTAHDQPDHLAQSDAGTRR